jgi:general secretion pathway protein D
MRISVSQGGNRIVVEGSEQDQKRAAEIIASVDKPALPGSGGIRVYRLENTSAQDVVDVLKALVEEQEAKATVQTPLASTPPGAMPRPRRGDVRQPDDLPAPRPSPSPATPASPAPAPKGSISITAAPDVNAVVIRAPAADQEAFADVIAQLDRPRDQVMLEMTLVTVSSDDTFRFGLEMGGSGFSGGTGQVSFTTFGIGQADSTTGSLVIDPDAPFGLNYNLFHSDDFSLVVNALQTVGDVRISSAPKVLIEDNTEALISLLTQEPYEVTSQGQSSTVTSFGGFVDAGTVLRAIPHISQQDWLRLEYQVELSSFRNRTAAQIAANIPPPKRQSVTSGTVRVPADCMVVLGGLIDTRHDETVDMVPVLGRIPGLGALFRNTEKGKQYQTLFVFIRPVVLRDPEFADLISLTRPDRVKAEVPEESMPANSLQLMESRPTVAPAAATEPSNG